MFHQLTAPHEVSAPFAVFSQTTSTTSLFLQLFCFVYFSCATQCIALCVRSTLWTLHTRVILSKGYNSSVSHSLRSEVARDIRDAFPGFPLFDFDIDGKTDIAPCSKIIAHNSQLVSLSVAGGISAAAGQCLLVFVSGRRSASGWTV